MNANEHYAEAERLLARAHVDEFISADYVTRMLAAAQVHATLALRLDK